jgi:hypothetical protein
VAAINFIKSRAMSSFRRAAIIPANGSMNPPNPKTNANFYCNGQKSSSQPSALGQKFFTAKGAKNAKGRYRIENYRCNNVATK